MKKTILAIATIAFFTVNASAQNKVGDQSVPVTPQQQQTDLQRTQDGNGNMTNTRDVGDGRTPDILDKRNRDYNNNKGRTDTLNNSSINKNQNAGQPLGDKPVK